MADGITGDSGSDVALNAAELARTLDELELRTENLKSSANGFASAMTQAFTQSESSAPAARRALARRFTRWANSA